MTQEFKAIIDEDIHRCEMILGNGDNMSCRDLNIELKSKYGKIIDGFSDNLYSLNYDEGMRKTRKNIEIMKRKLELFKAMGYENYYANKPAGVTFNNTNRVEATFNVSFENARNAVENMSALKESEIQEVLSKIEELEKITSSSDRKSKKWEQAKEIVKWIADKGVDVGIALLPLVLKIGQ